MPETVYTTGEAARLLGVHISTVKKWCNLGRIDAYRTSPIGHWRITKSTLEKYAQENGIPLQQNSSNE